MASKKSTQKYVGKAADMGPRLIVGALPGTQGYVGLATVIRLRSGHEVIIMGADMGVLQAAVDELWYGKTFPLDEGKCQKGVLVSPERITVTDQPEEDDEL